jgi:Domain of unknown function (DUF4397)
VTRIRSAIAVVGALTLVMSLSGVAAAKSDATLRVLNVQTPKTSIDVYFDGTLLLANVARNTLTDPVAIHSGTHHILITVASDPGSQLSVEVEQIEAGGSTLVSYSGGGSGYLFRHDEDQTVAGSALLRIWDTDFALDNVPNKDVRVDGVTLVTFLNAPRVSDYLQLVPGKHTVTIVNPGDDSVLFSFSVNLQSDTNYSAFVYPVSGSPHALLAVDAAPVSNTARAERLPAGWLAAFPGLLLLSLLALAIVVRNAVRERSRRA